MLACQARSLTSETRFAVSPQSRTNDRSVSRVHLLAYTVISPRLIRHDIECHGSVSVWDCFGSHPFQI